MYDVDIKLPLFLKKMSRELIFNYQSLLKKNVQITKYHPFQQRSAFIFIESYQFHF